MIIQAVAFHIFTVIFVCFSLLFFVEITIPVGIKIQKSSSCFQYPDPLTVGNVRMLQIPGKVSGNYNIKSVICKLQFLCIHTLKMNIFAKLSRILLCFFQHAFRIVHSIYFISCFCQDHREKSGACSNIQDPDLLLGLVWKITGQKLQPGIFLCSCKLFMINFGIPFCAGIPV